MIKFVVFLLVLVSPNVEAILPPLYQTASEIKSILENQQLGETLQSGESIIKIEKIDQGYELTTNKHHLKVDIIYEPSIRPGPAQFKLQFGTPIPL